MQTTQQVWDHHLETFAARDVPGVLEDYTDDSQLILNGEVHKGLDAIGAVFTGLFKDLPKDARFDLTNCMVFDKYVYIMWNAESDTVTYEFATDTFVIENGKITLQTIGAVRREK